MSDLAIRSCQRSPVAGSLGHARRAPAAGRARARLGRPVIRGRCCWAAPGGAGRAAARVLKAMGADAIDRARRPGARPRPPPRASTPPSSTRTRRRAAFKALVFDATGIATSDELVELQRFFYPTVRRCSPSGRVVVLGRPRPDARRRSARWRASRARSAKEIGRGATVQLVHVAAGRRGPARLDAALPAHAALGLRDGPGGPGHAVRAPPVIDRTTRWPARSRSSPARRAASARRSPRRWRATGAVVVRLGHLRARASERRARHHRRRRARARSPQRFTDGLDIVVHNAGVTKDRTLAKMPEDRWQSLMEVNLIAPERITDGAARRCCTTTARIVCVSSMSGIAGNARADQLRDLQGGRDRAGRDARADAASAGSRSTRSRPGSSRRR